MKNIDVINAFVNGETKGKTKNLRIEGDRLMNYNTCLAERKISDIDDYYIILNVTKYSRTTSTIQNALKRELLNVNGLMVAEVIDIPMGTESLR